MFSPRALIIFLMFAASLSCVPSASAGEDTIPPETVTDLAAAPGSLPESVDLMWTVPVDFGGSGVSSFNLRYANRPILTEVDFSNATIVLDSITFSTSSFALVNVTGLSLPGSYYFAVKAVDGDGNISAMSNTPAAIVVAAKDVTPPSTPIVRTEASESYLYDRLSAFWLTNDPETGIAENLYSLGTSSEVFPARDTLGPWQNSNMFIYRGRSAVLGNRIYDITPHPETHPGFGHEPRPSLSYMVSADIDASSGKVSVLRKVLAPQPLNDIYYTPIWYDGDCSGYISDGFSVAASSDSLYVTGGGIYQNGTAPCGAVNLTYYAKPDKDGNIPQWFSGTPLPFKASHHDSKVYNGHLYIFLASGVPGVYYISVFLSDINPVTGAIGQWRETSRVPLVYTGPGFSDRSVTIIQGKIFLLANDSLFVAKINNVNGELESWLPQTIPFKTNYGSQTTLYSEWGALASYDGRLFASGLDPQGNYNLYTARPEFSGIVPETGLDAWNVLSTAPVGGLLTENTRLYTGGLLAQLNAGGGDLFPFMSSGKAQKVTYTGINPQPGQTLYFSVKSRNSQGLWSEVGVSDGVLIKRDEQAPKIALTNPVNGHKLAGMPGAEAAAMNEGLGKLYLGGSEISVYDVVSENKTGTIGIASRVIGTNKNLGHLYAVSDYVPEGQSQKISGLFVVNANDNTILAKTPLPGNHLLTEESALAINEELGLVYLISNTSIEVFSANTGLFVRSLNVSARDIYYSPYSKTLYAAGVDSHLRGFKADADYAQAFDYALPGSPELGGLVIDENEKRAYLSKNNPGALIVVDLARKSVITTITAGDDTLGRSLLLNSESKRIYAAGSTSGIYVFNTKDNSLLGRLGFGPASSGVRSIAFNSSNQNYYSCEPSSGSVTVFEGRPQAFYKGMDPISVVFSTTDVNSPLSISPRLLKHDGLSVTETAVENNASPYLAPGFYSLRISASDPLGNSETLNSGMFEVTQDNIVPSVKAGAPVDAFASGLAGNPSYAVQDGAGDFIFVAKAAVPEIEVLDAADNYRHYRSIPLESVASKLMLDGPARKLYALHSSGVSVINADTHEKIGYLGFGSNLGSIAQSPETLFAGDLNPVGVYVVRKLQTPPYLEIVGNIGLSGLDVPPQYNGWVTPTSMVYDPSSDMVFVTGPELIAVDYQNRRTSFVAEGAGNITLDPVTNRLYLLSWFRKKLFTYNAGTFALERELDLSSEWTFGYESPELDINLNTQIVYASKGSNLWLIDGFSNTILNQITYPRSISSLSVGQAGKVILTHQGDNQITGFNEFKQPLLFQRFVLDVSDNNDLAPSLVKSVLTDLESGTEIPVSSGGLVAAPSTLDSGFYSLLAEAKDRVGNTDILKTGPFKITLEPTTFVADVLPPRTTLTFQGPHISSAAVIVSSSTVFGFTTEDDLAEIGDADGTGTIATRYSLDFGALGSGKFAAPAGGFHTLTYFSLDREHNTEAPRTTMLFVDGRAPISFITYPPPGEVLTGSSITITGVSYDFETETSRVEVSTNSGQSYGYAVVTGTSSDGGLLWEYPFALPRDYSPVVLAARAADIVGNMEGSPDIVPVFVFNKLLPQFLAEASPLVGKPGDEVLLRVKVLDQFSRPVANAPVNFSATTGILQPLGSTPAGFSPATVQTNEFGIAETTFTIPGKFITQEEVDALRVEYEKRAATHFRYDGGLPGTLGISPPAYVYNYPSVEEIVNQIGIWLANSRLISSQSEYNDIMSRVADDGRSVLDAEMQSLQQWLPRLAEMRRGVVTLSANTFGETGGFTMQISTVALNILSIPHPYDPAGFPTKDDGQSPNFITLGNRSGELTKEEMWGAVPGADSLIAYSKARREINYTNPSLHQQDFFNIGKTIKSVNKSLTNMWKSASTYPMQFAMNMAVMSMPYGGAFLAASDWAFKQTSGTGLEGMGLPIGHNFSFSLKDMVSVGLLPSVLMPPTGLNLGLDLNVSKGVAKGGAFAGFNFVDVGKSGLSASYRSLGGFSLDGYSGPLRVNAGQNDWYAGVDLLGFDAFKKIGSSAMSYGLNALNLTFIQGDWNGPVQFGIKDIKADWNAAKMLKSLDWSMQTPRFDMGKFGSMFNMETNWGKIPQINRGLNLNLDTGFNFPQNGATNWGGGTQGVSLGGDLSQGGGQSVCSASPSPGLPDQPQALPGAGSTKNAVFSSFQKQDGQEHGLYAAAGLTKNPVNTVSGNLLYWVEDALLPGPALFIQMVRIYNSLAPKNGPFGYGWSFNYGMSVKEGLKGAEVAWGDGGRRSFAKNADGTFSSPPGTYSKLAKEPDGSYVLTHNHGSAHIFTADGRLSGITDRNGNTLALAYAQGCLSSITDAAGRVVAFECDGAAHITKLTDFAGRSLTYQYNAHGDLVKVTGTDGYAADYSYGPAHELLAFSDPASRTGFSSGRLEYDEFNRVTAEFDPAGNRIGAFAYEFAEDNMTAEVTDAAGNTMRDTYDADGSWKSRINPDGRETKLTFDQNANLVKMDDGVAVTEKTYDALNRLQSVKSGADTVVSYVYDGDSARVSEERLPDGAVVAYGYDAKGNIVSISEPGTDPGRGSAHVEYDAKGNPVRLTDALGHATIMAYDAAGNRVSVTDPAGGVRTYSYTASGKLASTVDETGKTTAFAWSPKNFLETITYPDNGTYSFAYNAAGKVLSETNERGEATVYSYDLRGEPVLVTDPDGSVTELSYNLNGQMTGVKDQAGDLSVFTYDPAGRMTGYTDPEGGSFSVTYDARGRASAFTDAEGKTVSVAYDDRDRPVMMTDPLGGRNSVVYNAAGRISSITDPRNHVTSYSYDSRRLPVSITGPGGAVYSFEYDKAGNMTAMTTPDGTRLDYTYDQNNKLKAVTDPADQGNALVSFGLDPAGRVTSIKDAAGRTTSFELAWDGKPKTITAPDGTYAAISYDKMGNPVSIRDPNGNVTLYEYDAFSHQTKQTDAAGNSILYAYDPVGRPSRITYPDGSFYAMEYDKAGRMNKYTDPEGHSRSYRYDRNSNIDLETDGRGNIWDYSYDANGRLTTVVPPVGPAVAYGHDANGNVASVRDAAGNLFTFEYDAANRLTKAVDPAQNTELIARDAAGRITEFTDKAGRKQKYTRNRFGYVASYEDPLGLITTYEYDKLQRPVSIVNPSGLTQAYQYDSLGRMTSYSYGGLTSALTYDAFGNLKTLVNPAGKTTTYSYDNLKRLTTAVSPAGTERYAYNSLSRVTSFTDAAGAARLYTYDLTGRLLSEKDPLGNTTSFEYDADGNRLAVTDAAGNTSRYVYDEVGRLIQSAPPSGEATTYEYDANSNQSASVAPGNVRTEYVYDAQNRLVSARDPSGATTSYEYDAAGNQTAVTSPDGGVMRSYYDAGDRLIETVDAAGGITLYAYDAEGNIKSVTDPAGKVTGYVYDGAGRLTGITNPDQSAVSYTLDNEGKTTATVDELGRTLAYTYDTAGRLTQTRDALNRTVSYTYDAAGRRLTETDAGGHVTRYEYDAAGRLTAVVDPLNKRTTREYDQNGALKRTVDPLDRATTYTYDAAGRLIRVTDALGGVLSYGYDEAGRKTLETYPDGRSVSSAYDQAGRLASRADAAGNRTLYEYDQSGRLSSETDPKGNRTLYTYDTSGRLITVTDAEGGVWDYAYTAAGLLASIKDANAHTTAFAYDARNRLAVVTDPLSNATRFEYDLAGRRTKLLKPTGEAVEYTYDAGDRITTIKSGSAQRLFTWSPDDLLLTSDSSFGWEYDAAHRLTKTLYKDLNKNVQFAYDAVGNRTKITRDDLSSVNYEYDALNRLSAVTGLLNTRYTFSYDPAGRPLTRVYPNGVTSGYSYNTGGRLEKLEHRKADGALLASFGYTYDANGNRLSMTDNLGERLYTYDKLNRLTKAAYASGRTQEFTYDPAGNRTKLTEEWPEILAKINKVDGTLSNGKLLKTVDYAYDAADRLLTAGNKAYTHDTAGRLLKTTDNTGDTLFSYDLFDRPLSITYPSSVNPQPSVYTYAPMLPDLRFTPSPIGARTSKRDSQGLRSQILDDRGDLLSEVDTAIPGYPVTKNRYVHAGLDTPLAILDENNLLYHYLPDGLGSTAMLTDKRGDPVQVYDYEAYGKPNVTAADKNTIKYTGRDYDPDAKLQYNRARYYDPELGRWITPDPLANKINTDYYSQANLTLPVNLNKCAYGRCNPVNYTDPLGLAVSGGIGLGGTGVLNPYGLPLSRTNPGTGICTTKKVRELEIGDIVYRVWDGFESPEFGRSWTDVYPKTVTGPVYRERAGLPDGNLGLYLTKASILDTKEVYKKNADMLYSKIKRKMIGGAWPEVIIPKPNQVQKIGVSEKLDVSWGPLP